MPDSAEETFSVNLEGNLEDVAGRDAAALEKLVEGIRSSSESLKEMGTSLRSLRGKSDEVLKAKEELRGRIEAERGAVSRANLALLKQGTSYSKVEGDLKSLAAEKTKAAAEEKAADEEKEKRLEKLKQEIDREAEAERKRVAAGKQATAVDKQHGEHLKTLAKFVGGGTLAVIAGAAAFAGFGAAAADASRSLNLLAATGAEQNAKNLGTQVDALAMKLATPKEALDDLAAELRRKNPYLSGTELVATFQTVASAASAAGDSVGKSFEDIMTRGARMQRMQITPQELLGTGVKFQDVAAELAKNLKIGVKDAQAALFEGRVRLEDGSKALKAAVDKRYGDVNAKKLLGLGTIATKTEESVAAIFSGINAEPGLVALKDLADTLSQSTKSGQLLKAAVSTIGNLMVKGFVAAEPIIKSAFKTGIILALDFTIGILRVIKFAKELDAQFGIVKGTLDAIKAAKDAVFGEDTKKNAATGPQNRGWADDVPNDVKALDEKWRARGQAVGDGLAAGIKASTPNAAAATKGLTDAVDAQVKGDLKIHSPSQVMTDAGAQIPAGLARGVTGGLPQVADAAAALAGAARPAVPPPQVGAGAPAGPGGGAGRPPEAVLRVLLEGKGSMTAEQGKQGLGAPDVRAELLRMIEGIARELGIPVAGTVTA